jgi:hypothetical protein
MSLQRWRTRMNLMCAGPAALMRALCLSTFTAGFASCNALQCMLLQCWRTRVTLAPADPALLMCMCACLPHCASLLLLYLSMQFDAALAHQNDFDVCWPRGSIAETIFTPMVERIQSAGGQVVGEGCVL